MAEIGRDARAFDGASPRRLDPTERELLRRERSLCGWMAAAGSFGPRPELEMHVTSRRGFRKMRGIMIRPTEAFQSANLFDLGLGHVLVARFRGSGEVELGAFLVDVNCLGVKDAFFTRASQTEYDERLLERILPAANRQPLDPPSARKLVEDAVAYAQRLGFAPHPDYKLACRVLGGIRAADSTATFTFGKGGKPFYVQGRYDSSEKCLRILNQLRTRCGEDGFDFLAVGGDPEIRELERAGFTIRQKVPAPPPGME